MGKSSQAQAYSTQVSQMQPEELERQWRPVFDKFDYDHDGVVPLLEFRQQLLDLNLRRELPEEVIDEILIRADRNHDGRINYDEFISLVRAKELNPAGRPLFRRMLVAAAYSVVPRKQRASQDSYIQQYSCCPPPLFMPLISVVELALFIYYAVKLGGVSASGPVPFESKLIYNPSRRYEAWRYVSYMFIHAGLMHIITNLVVQLIIGIPLEMVHRWWRILIIYMCGVLAGSLGTSVVDPEVYLAGASGGVYAVLAAHLANLIMNWKEMELAIMRLIMIAIMVAADVGTAIYYRYTGTETKTGYFAHFAGAVAGLLVGINVLKNLRVHKWERVVWWISLVLFTFLMLAAIIINVAYPEHFLESE